MVTVADYKMHLTCYGFLHTYVAAVVVLVSHSIHDLQTPHIRTSNDILSVVTLACLLVLILFH
jgi:hypothetical protein